jgi:two-component system, OmpR family, sensor histidine kinase MprB
LTFRTRLVLAATVAVVVAVLLASTAAYLATRRALINSVDDSLIATADSALTSGGCCHAVGITPQVVDSTGDVLLPGSLPVDSHVVAVAQGEEPQFFTDQTVHGVDVRELVTHLPAGTQVLVPGSLPLFLNAPGGALQLATQTTGITSELHTLGIALIVVAIAGILLAVLLGWLVARTALVPLDNLTRSVEEVADTTDVSKRLDAGGPDELGRLRRAFNRMLAALERSRESQRQLVLDAAHELRTPLTSLRTNIEVVRRIEDLPEDDRRVLVHDVLSQMEELTTLIGDLAELARGEQPHQERTLFRLDDLVEDAVNTAATHGRARGVQFSLHRSPTLVRAQRDGVARAVGNLLDNALKWSPDGATVEVVCAEGDVVVRDHGPGIAPADLPHIFDRFYRAPAARSLPGSGLGLAIVAQVAHAEGGEVAAGAAPGGGALLRIRLPVVSPELDGAPAVFD